MRREAVGTGSESGGQVVGGAGREGPEPRPCSSWTHSDPSSSPRLIPRKLFGLIPQTVMTLQALGQPGNRNLNANTILLWKHSWPVGETEVSPPQQLSPCSWDLPWTAHSCPVT